MPSPKTIYTYKGKYDKVTKQVRTMATTSKVVLRKRTKMYSDRRRRAAVGVLR